MTAPLLLVTDIWGQHQTLDPLLAELAQHFPQVTVLDPYSGQRFVFNSDADAYGYFQRRCSARAYQQKLQQRLDNADGKINLLAFSAGANAAWPLLAQSNKVNKAALVYGSQIPTEAELAPKCPTQLWLCQDDDGVKAQQSALNQHADLVISEQPHGYFNPRSQGYDPIAATQDLAILIRYLQRQD
ncbi:dienelactone hydrolase family protein [uncultured Ferrimonas sp.]|uniref:dienelactone hydrolase family protein n=1 Tax=uncultured Ferrimonas sp. TaxID=432640 RepID=UPI0026142F51|nr:dienelactone hydrolase family protein [uncultured Ferrimonas sp.]